MMLFHSAYAIFTFSQIAIILHSDDALSQRPGHLYILTANYHSAYAIFTFLIFTCLIFTFLIFTFLM